MSDTPSIRLRTRRYAPFFGVACLVSLACGVSTMASLEWDSARWKDILIILFWFIFVALCIQCMVDAWILLLEANQNGIYNRKGWNHKPIILNWNEVKNWEILRAGWKDVELEGGGKQRIYKPNWNHIHFYLSDGREWFVTLTDFGPLKTEQFIAVLRTYIGDREFPEYIGSLRS